MKKTIRLTLATILTLLILIEAKAQGQKIITSKQVTEVINTEYNGIFSIRTHLKINCDLYDGINFMIGMRDYQIINYQYKGTDARTLGTQSFPISIKTPTSSVSATLRFWKGTTYIDINKTFRGVDNGDWGGLDRHWLDKVDQQRILKTFGITKENINDFYDLNIDIRNVKIDVSYFSGQIDEKLGPIKTQIDNATETKGKIKSLHHKIDNLSEDNLNDLQSKFEAYKELAALDKNKDYHYEIKQIDKKIEALEKEKEKRAAEQEEKRTSSNNVSSTINSSRTSTTDSTSKERESTYYYKPSAEAIAAEKLAEKQRLAREEAYRKMDEIEEQRQRETQAAENMTSDFEDIFSGNISSENVFNITSELLNSNVFTSPEMIAKVGYGGVAIGVGVEVAGAIREMRIQENQSQLKYCIIKYKKENNKLKKAVQDNKIAQIIASDENLQESEELILKSGNFLLKKQYNKELQSLLSKTREAKTVRQNAIIKVKTIYRSNFSSLSAENRRIEISELLKSMNLAEVSALISPIPKNGEFTSYHNTGEINENGTYFLGDKNGTWTSSYDNGNLKSTTDYKTGNKNGDIKIFYSNGKLEMTGKYYSNKKTGDWVSYYQNENIEAFGQYSDDKMIGSWQWNYPNGEIKAKQLFTNGKYNGQGFRYHENGKVNLKMNFVNGLRSGIWIWYHENGKLFSSVEYHHNVYDKKNSTHDEKFIGYRLNAIEAYDSNGNELNIGTLTAGKGTLLKYSSDGTLRKHYIIKGGLIDKEKKINQEAKNLRNQNIKNTKSTKKAKVKEPKVSSKRLENTQSKKVLFDNFKPFNEIFFNAGVNTIFSDLRFPSINTNDSFHYLNTYDTIWEMSLVSSTPELSLGYSHQINPRWSWGARGSFQHVWSGLESVDVPNKYGGTQTIDLSYDQNRFSGLLFLRVHYGIRLKRLSLHSGVRFGSSIWTGTYSQYDRSSLDATIDATPFDYFNQDGANLLYGINPIGLTYYPIKRLGLRLDYSLDFIWTSNYNYYTTSNSAGEIGLTYKF